MHPTDITARAALVGTAMMTAAVAVLATAPSAAAEDFGPDTCRQGYVWREARPTDHVCVTPATRDRARYDNSRAAGRRDPGHGGYGPNACKEGYVWREAFSGDVVCVEPATRSQARQDNQLADSRKVSARLWKTRWFAAPRCDGDTCTAPDGIARIQLNGDHYNYGQVRVYIRRTSDNRLLWSGTATARAQRGYAGGAFGIRTNVNDCSRQGRRPNGYAQAYDVVSGRWSARTPVTIGCAVL
ncbi:hypothetical protein [Streptomyces melanogenes]|uniref:Secreted protein n=1 Tax=Streptomyces melanogenes TaxID=67326 RepID=A0ABZ1XBZ5_9ACTN|nr:hypothetical protein [Streptomyces melanogenes]